ncbi:hypothetical protein [Roseateles oligotrophus]|uniref:Uncharacterized protein n=1 Tax=Roseateles oligotrophus TaxID=1769250 RepID=A0ABT2YN83_9BURK|nr:hypothetical protein [Roseateles oligotrophus]MCV2371386.1 hypothetical protein [Roseateles oligotrophus]
MSTIALPPSIAHALGSLVPELKARGVVLAGCEESVSFGNFEAKFARGSLTFSIVRDRGQFHIDGAAQDVLELAGLWRSFSGVNSMAPPLFAWVESKNAA